MADERDEVRSRFIPHAADAAQDTRIRFIFDRPRECVRGNRSARSLAIHHRKRLRRISAIRIGSCTDAILERGVPLPDAPNVRGLAGQVVLPSSPGGAPGVLPFAGLFPRRVSVHF